METQALIPLALSVIGALLVTISTLIGWIGLRMIRQLDDLSGKLSKLSLDVFSELSRFNYRITLLEMLTKDKV